MKPIVEPILKRPEDFNFFRGILNAAWLSAALWFVGYLIYRHMSAVDAVVAKLIAQ